MPQTEEIVPQTSEIVPDFSGIGQESSRIGQKRAKISQIIARMALSGTKGFLDSFLVMPFTQSWRLSPENGRKTQSRLEQRPVHRSVDLFGRVYKYFLTRFASAEGKNGGPAKCEVGSASVEVKKSRPFVIRNSAFAIPPADIGKEHADTFSAVHQPTLQTFSRT